MPHTDCNLFALAKLLLSLRLILILYFICKVNIVYRDGLDPKKTCPNQDPVQLDSDPGSYPK